MSELPDAHKVERPAAPSSARDLVAFVLRRCEDHRAFFRRLCFAGHYRMRAQAWQYHAQSQAMGWRYSRADIEDALWELACALFPESPAAKWDTAWAQEIFAMAEDYLEGQQFRHALTPDEEAEYVLRADRAMEEGARTGRRAPYRAALREWMHAAQAASRSPVEQDDPSAT